MMYTLDDRLFRYAADEYAGVSASERIWVGVGAWLFARDPQRVHGQLAMVRRRPPLGESLFSWDSIRSSPELHAILTDATQRE